jgi:cobalamin-dependent methionine synthase I
MRNPGLRAGLLLLLLSACGGSDKRVIDQYFNAVRAKDNQTLSSFATVSFDKPVENWKITNTSPETKSPVILPGLATTAQDLDKKTADNKKAAQVWNNEHFAEREQLQELRKKGGAIPAKLQPIAEQWDTYNKKDRDLKKDHQDAVAAVEKEKRNVKLSVGDVENVETLQGDMLSMTVDVDLTIAGKVEPYTMTLRKYDLQREGPRIVSRWIVQGLQPKS